MRNMQSNTTKSLQDQLLETKLRIEQAKLKKLEADLPKETPQYTRYEDLPPPSPEDEKRFYENFKKLFHVVATDYGMETDDVILAKQSLQGEFADDQFMTGEEIFAAAENELMLEEDNPFQEPPDETVSPHTCNRPLALGLRDDAPYIR